MDTKQEGDNFNKKDLFSKAMSGDWPAVIDIYKRNPLARQAKATWTKHTVLHLAVSEEDDEVVEQLVNALEENEACEILNLQNEFGYTPLHVAAARGLDSICWLLAEKCYKLVNVRNKARETPLYVAAYHGKKKAFFVLQDYVPENLMREQKYGTFCRKGDGNTILHAAVNELAIEIIKLYPGLVEYKNEMGQSPLHLLADKPLVFKSGSRLWPTDELLYACIIVDRLEPKYQPGRYTSPGGWKKAKEIKQNYAACMDLFRVLQNVYSLFASCFGERSIRNCYTPNKRQSKDLERDEENGNHVRSTKPRFPKNSITTCNFLKIVIKLVIRVLLLLLGLGIRRIDTIKREKKKHEYASQVMKELVSLYSNWEYAEDGKMPNKGYESTIDASTPPDEESSASNSESSKGIIMQIKHLQKDEDRRADELKREETPILVATRRGIVEMVKNILDVFPIAVEDIDSNHKNIILLSAEHRQPQVYKHMLERMLMRESDVFGRVDKDGNSALHLAASTTRMIHPWVIPGTALHMQWEIKWYKGVLCPVVDEAGVRSLE